MKNICQISLQQAQLLALHSQGLLKPDVGTGKNAALGILERLGYVQIDTLAVVSRAHHHTLWSRCKGYDESILNELLEKDKSVFEYWSHAASYLPMKDYRFSLPGKKAYATGKSHWFAQDKKMKAYVLDRIKAEGPLQSKDFEHKRSGPRSWYEWKPAKKALEQLFMEGKLMVARRHGFQKVYDLPERLLPPDTDTFMPGPQQYAEHVIERSIQAHGILDENEITYLRPGLKKPVAKALRKNLKEGKLIEVQIEGIEKRVISTSQKIEALKNIKSPEAVHLLSPFDNMVIQRKRLQRLFGFDYVIECYLPESKRKYGYFTLPVLYNNQFVARFDPKADRNKKIFYIRSVHFEKGFTPSSSFNVLFAAKLKEFALFNGCNKIEIENADAKWKKELTAMFR